MAKKIYAVRQGRTVGLFYSWEECKTSVEGYSGAEYKSFSSEEDAINYLNNSGPSKAASQPIQGTENADGVVAYVDGSYDDGLHKYSFGCIIITPKGEIIKEAGCGDDADAVAIRNVAGELSGAIFATRWAIENGYHSIEIRHDYEGISKWVTGDWKAKNRITQHYVDEMNKMQRAIKITFTKVVAHSNNTYNEEAERIAKEALKTGSKKRIAKGEYWFRAEGIEEADILTIVDLVKEENNDIKISESKIPYGKQIVLTFNKERVVVNYYGDKKSVTIQGKPQTLFSLIISFITELVDVEKIPEIFNSSFNITVKKDDVKTQFRCYLPHAWDKLARKVSRVLHQAVYNLNLQGDVFEASFLALPAFRVLEGHLKSLLINYQIVPDDATLKRDGFNMFDKEGFNFRLKSDMMGIAPPEVARYIGQCYTYYNNNRNRLVHWDDPTAAVDTTVVIDVATAHDHIKDILRIIDEYYKMFGKTN